MKHLLVAALLAAVYCVSAIAETKVISLKLNNPISVGSTKTIEASFESLDPQADAAFRRAVFTGQATYEKLSNGETRVIINWDGVKDGSKSASVEPFITRVATSDPSIAAGTTLKARGDTALLTAAIRNMKENGAKTASNGGNGVITGSGTTAQSSALNTYSSAQSSTPARSSYSSTPASSGNFVYSTPSSGSTGSSGGSTGSGSSASSGSNCKPIIDLEANTYTLTTKEGNQCVPSDTSSIYETAQGCPQIADYNRSTVLISTRKYALPLGNETRVVPCAQTSETAPLTKTFEGCNQRHDFLTHYTYEQERYYFLWQEERNYLTDCRDSDVKYAHYLTTATCEPQNAVGKLIPQKRIAYNQSDGTVGYATACKPVSDEIAILKEFCEYEHDFVTNQSYRQERDYYIDPVSLDRIYLTNCSRTNLNFPHQQESAGWVHDDEALRSILNIKKYFIDTTNGDKVYPNSEELIDGSSVPYANKGTFERIKTDLGVINNELLTAINGVYRYNGNLLDISKAVPISSGIKTYASDKLNYYATCSASHTEYSSINDSTYTVCDAYSPTSACSALSTGFGLSGITGPITINGSLKNGSGCYVGIGKAKIAEIKREIDYLRPDGSTYSVEIDSFYQVQP